MKKKIFSIWSVLLILIVSIAVLVPGCDGADAYRLTVAVSPPGAGTTTPTGTTTHTAGTAVNISAVAAPCYQFDEWTGDDSTIADVNAAATTITMNGHYSITANFVPTPPDHYKFYDVDYMTAPYVGEEVQLVDQFGTFNVTVEDAWSFGNPVDKTYNDELTPIADENRHYTVYYLYYDEEDYVIRSVEVSNQFGNNQELIVAGPYALAVPTTKEGHEEPVCLNHYLLYYAYGPSLNVSVELNDQFVDETVTVYEPYYFANPVKKTVDGEVTKIEDPDEHYVFYAIEDAQHESIQKTIDIDNQFGPQTLELTYRDTLAVPSEKLAPPVPPTDHFKCYPTEGFTLNQPVLLADQFGYYEPAEVGGPMWFCNPVMKNAEPIVNDDNHLTVYTITWDYPTYWYVDVDNQFGYQELVVYGPVALAVPTQKVEPGGHPEPKYLNHFLLYDVIEGGDVNVTVDLDDQFPGSAPGVLVTTPVYFANPVLAKMTLEEDMTGAWDPEAHLVFYTISENPEDPPESVLVNNQFEEDLLLGLATFWELLAVPSQKSSYGPYVPD